MAQWVTHAVMESWECATTRPVTGRTSIATLTRGCANAPVQIVAIMAAAAVAAGNRRHKKAALG